MNDRDLIPLDADAGHRTPTSGGDRLMVLLAVVALAGGLAIAFGNLIPPSDDPTAVASTAATATAVPSRTPKPSPTPRPLGQILVTPGDPPASEPPQYWYQEWIRALQDLEIRAMPAADAPSNGMLAAGDLALAQGTDGDREAPGWLYIVDGGSTGWVQVEIGGKQLAERYPTYPNTWARLYAEVAAGDAGFIARAEGGTLATSPNGLDWTPAQDSDGVRDGLYGTAWGPAGWLAASSTGGRFGPAEPYLWRSDDGHEWVPVGRMETGQSGFGFNGIWGSSLGYLMMGGDNQGHQSLWFSTNGIAWLEMPPTGLESNDTWLQVTPTSHGFLLVADGNGSRHASAPAVFTADGGTWVEVNGGPGSAWPLMAALDDRLVAIDRDPVSDVPRVWIATIGGESLDWVAESSASATFAGTVPAVMVSDSQRLVAIGWDRETEDLRAWSSPDGAAWTPLALPPGGFGVIPHQALGSPAGIIVMGTSDDNGIQTLQSWRLAGDHWLRSDLPAVLGIDQLDASDCPGAPRDALDFIALDPGVAVHCFGDTPLTFTAYSMECLGCDGGADDTVSPAWLAPGDPRIFLSPIVTQNQSWLDVVLGPTLEPDSAWQGAWVRVVGHFDDPAATDCRQRLDPDMELWYAGRQQLVEECRRRFVITDVTVVDGP